MKRVLVILAAAIFPVLAAVTVVSFAQQPAPQDNIVVKQRVVQTQDGEPVPKDFIFIASEMNFDGKVVKGAPYSAQAVTETIQTLSDGNRIVNKSTSSLYRDSDGRTRREQSLKMLGALGDGGEPLQTIFINDPVAGVTYSLDSRTKIAHKSTPFKVRLAPGAAAGSTMALPPGADTQHFEFKTENGGTVGGVVVRTQPGASAAAGAPSEAGSQVFHIRTESGGEAAYIFRRTARDDNRVKEEQLGKQLIEGVVADGVRTTITIPAGEIGNERPIEIVNERWYSPELQMVIMTRNSDPRSGETTYRLTNIARLEPAKSLFEVPADYTVKEGMPGAPNLMQLPARVRRPE